MTAKPVLLGLVLAGAALLAAAPPAAAHDHEHVHGYDLTIGFLAEPAIVDEPNAVSLRVTGPVESGNITPNATFSFTFPIAGTYRYHCHHHPWQQGNVTIVDGHGGGHGQGAAVHHVEILDGATADAMRFLPENLTIAVGDTVVWHNNGTLVHTVSPGEPGLHGHGDGEGEHEHGDGGYRVPTTGLEGDLRVEVRIGGETMDVAMQPRFREPGHYIAHFIPTVAGTYTFHFTGTLGGKALDLEHPYENEAVQDRGDLEFPAAGVDNLNTKKRLDAAEDRIDALDGNLSGGLDAPAPAALAVAAALAAVALVAARRR